MPSSEFLRILASDSEPDYDDELWWAPPSRSLGWASLAGPRSRDCLAVISQLTFVCWSQHNFHPGPGLAWPGLGGASVTNLEALEPPWPGSRSRAGASVMRAPGPGIRTWVSPASGRADSGECGVRVGARSRRLDTGDTHSNPASGVKRETTSVTSGDQGGEHYPGTTARCHKTHHTEQSPSVTRKYHNEKKKKIVVVPKPWLCSTHCRRACRAPACPRTPSRACPWAPTTRPSRTWWASSGGCWVPRPLTRAAEHQERTQTTRWDSGLTQVEQHHVFWQRIDVTHTQWIVVCY